MTEHYSHVDAEEKHSAATRAFTPLMDLRGEDDGAKGVATGVVDRATGPGAFGPPSKSGGVPQC